MKNREIIKKLITILGIVNVTFGGIIENRTLLIIGGIMGIIGTIMLLGVIK